MLIPFLSLYHPTLPLRPCPPKNKGRTHAYFLFRSKHCKRCLWSVTCAHPPFHPSSLCMSMYDSLPLYYIVTWWIMNHGAAIKREKTDPSYLAAWSITRVSRISLLTCHPRYSNINLPDCIVYTVNRANCFEGRLTDRAGLDFLSMFHGFIIMQALPSIFLIGVCGGEGRGWWRFESHGVGVQAGGLSECFTPHMNKS